MKRFIKNQIKDQATDYAVDSIIKPKTADDYLKGNFDFTQAVVDNAKEKLSQEAREVALKQTGNIIFRILKVVFRGMSKVMSVVFAIFEGYEAPKKTMSEYYSHYNQYLDGDRLAPNRDDYR